MIEPEPFEDVPMFEVPDQPAPRPDANARAGAHAGLHALARQHAQVIDMVGEAIDFVRAGSVATPELKDRWNKLTEELKDANSPVVVFLIRVLADILVQFDVDKESILAKMRIAAASRMEAAEQTLRKRGYLT